jgi:hypothetical protein
VSNPIDDRAFEEYLSRNAQVSRNYRELDADDVPVHLDERVLAQARAALSSPASHEDDLARLRRKRQRLMRWGVPAAIAASALLVVSIVIRTGSQHEVQQPRTRPIATAMIPEAPPMARPAPAPEVAPEAAESLVLIAPPRDATTEFSPFAVNPPDRARTDNRATRQPPHSSDGELDRKERSDAPFVTSAPRLTGAEPAVDSVGAPLAMTDAAPPAVNRSPAAAEREPTQEPVRTAASAPEEPPDQSFQRKSVAEHDSSLEEIVLTGMRRAPSAAAGGGPRGTVPETAQRDSEQAGMLAKERYIDPQAWLDHIRQLRKDGKHRAAESEWKRFRLEYPDYDVAATDVARGKNED